MFGWLVYGSVIVAVIVWSLYMERLDRLRQIERERRLRIESEIQAELLRLEERSRRTRRWTA